MLNNFSKINHPVNSGTRTLPNSIPILFPLDLDLNFAIRPEENMRTRVLVWPPAVHLLGLARRAGVASPTGKRQTRQLGCGEEMPSAAGYGCLGPANAICQ